MSALTIYFNDLIYPSFPFSDNSWLAVAFDRDKYDNRRFPRHFFDFVHDEFAHDNSFVDIGRDAPVGSRKGSTVDKIEFNWDTYSCYMLSKENYSPSYRAAGSAGNWAFWSNTSISVWGGEMNRMAQVFQALGGVEAVRAMMYEEFAIENGDRYEEIRSYIDTLLGLNSVASDS